ncbi:simple sugar transport system ATP-binding protein [Aureimonas jatrophae]|uniref:Nucleoside ABC transporter ATP-binding protein n=2 Tax=Aureimonas jatrophae TaxID=1166073 RepID=A0A1H0DHK7_9HYPH|nr:simple sugar transport system ATP-binding protein [Aureimonas jatrophae]SDN69574.1 nucleoside ABC transporter ATP-binding protein [Aureimonas jatrophae]
MSALPALPDEPPDAMEMRSSRPILEAVGLTKRFGAFTALDDVTIALQPGEFHALLGENGAGKSTLVKCILGYYQPDAGAVVLDGREVAIASPRDARRLGLGMVYQHFTLVPAMSVLENLVMAGATVPRVVDWRTERRRLAAFMETMPLRVPLDVAVDRLSAGERQKTEILKQLYLGSRVLVLDEPTSVLTPNEAEEVLSFLRARASETGMAVLLITHKFSEVTRFCDRVSVLRKGRPAGAGKVADLTVEDMARMMIGERELAEAPARAASVAAPPVLRLRKLAAGHAGTRGAIAIDHLEVAPGEIVGIAGISGNGQTTLVEVLSGQTPAEGGVLEVGGEPYRASRAEAQARKVRCLPEEPLRNACVGRMSVSENLAFRTFDHNAAGAPIRLLDRKRMRGEAERLITAYSVKTQSPASPIATLSGGNVQRAVLARELQGETDLLVVANPCFGLDFGAVADIRAQLMAARNRGTAVLLVSEDLDEVIALSDRIFVLFEGRIVMETRGGASADPFAIGRAMAGHV